MNRTEKAMLNTIDAQAGMLGLAPITVARMLVADARWIAQEDRDREVRRQAAVERGEAAAWAHQHANADLGLPADTPMSERLALLNPHVEDVVRDPAAPYGSAANPAFFVTAGDGTPLDIGFQAQQQRASAQRSYSETVDDALIARAKAQCSDSYMLIQRSQAQSRRKHAEAARHEAALATAAAQRGSERRASGTGWPELSR